MTDLEQLIEVVNELCNTLSNMADNERKFGFEICHHLEILSYDTLKTANGLKQINHYLTGVEV